MIDLDLDLTGAFAPSLQLDPSAEWELRACGDLCIDPNLDRPGASALSLQVGVRVATHVLI